MRKGAVRATKLETLARIVGRDLDKVARQLARAGVRSPARRSMRELPAIALGNQLAQARAQTRAQSGGRVRREPTMCGALRRIAELRATAAARTARTGASP
jgi:hypothetical protein